MSALRRGPTWLTALPRPIRSGHRGAAGLLPANTLASYERAVELGCHLIEMDVQSTVDGVLVLYHDDHLTIGGERCQIDGLTLSQLRAAALGDGVEVPSLAEALVLLRGRAVPLLDLKGIGFERQLGDAVRVAGIDQAVVCGRPLESLLATHAANTAIATSLTYDARALSQLDAALVPDIPTDAVTVDHRRLTAEVVGWFHDAGITVLVWTVDDPARMRTLLALGVDGITTNRPDLLAQAAGA